MNGTKYRLECMNAFVAGIYGDFDTDEEAARYAADYEATCYRINPDGTQAVIYRPGQDDPAEDATEVSQ